MIAPSHRSALDRLIRPTSIAIIGASAEPLSAGANTLVNLDRFGYPGAVHLVSRKGGTIGERPCHTSIDDLPSDIDAAVLIVPAQVVAETIAACGRKRIGGAVVFASGFAEQDEAGREAQAALTARANDAGMALIGPNCIGLVNYAGLTPLTFEPVDPNPPARAGVCVIAQSGAMSGNIRYALQGRGTPVSHSISTGNEALIGSEDCIDLLLDDPAVAVFAIFVEQIRKPQIFLQLAERARNSDKPIVLLHSGRGTRAREAARTHTGALAGDYATMHAFLSRAGVVLVESPDEMFDVCALLAANPRPTQGGLAVLSNSGALRGLGLDLADDVGATLPAFEAQTVAALREALPSFATIDNPLDVTAAGMMNPGLFGASARAILADPGIGRLLVAVMGGGGPQQMAKWQALKPELTAATKPVALCYLGDDYPLDPAFLEDVRSSGVPFFRSPERAIRAFARLEAWSATAVAEADGTARPDGSRLHVVGSGPIAEWRCKAMLAEVGIAVPRGKLARTVDEACSIARAIGFPVVLKAQADTLAHKSDVGGVAVGLADESALASAYDAMSRRTAAARPDLTLDGLLVEALAPTGGLEMIVGARRDPHWGPVLLVGLGGIWTETLHDVRLLPASADAAAIARALDGLKGAALLQGSRGSPPRDVAALSDLAAKVGALIEANDSVVEIDLNPVNVYASGEGAVALDAVVVTA